MKTIFTINFALLMAIGSSLFGLDYTPSALKKEQNAIYQMQTQLSNTLKELAQVEQQLCENIPTTSQNELIIEQKFLWHEVARIEKNIALREVALAPMLLKNNTHPVFSSWAPIGVWTAITTARTTKNPLASKQFSKLIELLQELAAVEKMIASCALDNNDPLDATVHEESIILAKREALREGITLIK